MQFEFVGRVIEWRGPAPYFYVGVPQEVSDAVSDVAASVTYGWGAIPVEADIAGTAFTTSLFPKDGRYLLPLRAAVRQRRGIGLDVEVVVEMRLGRD